MAPECPYQWSEWVGVDGSKSVKIGPPEPFGPAGVELWHRLAELLACVAIDPADREPPPGTPLLAVQTASLRWVERGTEAVDDVDLEGTLRGVSGLVIGHVGHVVGAPLEGHVGLQASQVDNLHLLTALVVENWLVPSHHGRSVAGSEPNVTLKTHALITQWLCVYSSLLNRTKWSKSYTELQFVKKKHTPSPHSPHGSGL